MGTSKQPAPVAKRVDTQSVLKSASGGAVGCKTPACTASTEFMKKKQNSASHVIKLDKENKVLSTRERGIGMTKVDLIKNLGTIAKSGISGFVEKMKTSGDLDLIGHFGVGFYAVYRVADYVEVISKHNDDKQYIWESKADGSFVVSEDVYKEPLGYGTEIRLHLIEEGQEYLEEDKLKVSVSKP